VGVGEGVGEGVGVGVGVGEGVGVGVMVGVATRLNTFGTLSLFIAQIEPGMAVNRIPNKKYFHRIFIFKRRIIAALEGVYFLDTA